MDYTSNTMKYPHDIMTILGYKIPTLDLHIIYSLRGLEARQFTFKFGTPQLESRNI